MMYFFTLFLIFLTQVNTSPTPSPDFSSVFHDPSIPILDSLDTSLFNLTQNGKASHPRDTDNELVKRAFNLGWILINVVLDGRNLGSPVQFQKTGQIILFTGVPTSPTINNRNPYDVVIASGNPIGSPVSGTLNYVTNRYLDRFTLGNQVDLFDTAYDFAYVTNTANSVTVTIDTRTAQLNGHAFFNLETGVLAEAFKVTSGSFTVNLLANNAVSGRISIVGDSTLRAGRRAYNAIIRGVVVGRGQGPI